jgi:hypothetical protein
VPRKAARHTGRVASAAPVSFPAPRSYIPAMNDLAYWTKRLQEAERELDAATRRSDVNAAAKKLQMAKAELKRLERKAPTRPGSGVAVPAAS